MEKIKDSEINFKQVLLKNAEDKLIDSVDKKINQIDSELNKTSKDFNLILKDFNNPDNIIKTNLSKSEEQELRSKLSKNSYHFPDVINIGELISEKTIHSKILKENSFKTKIPLLIPLQNAGISFLINHKFRDRINEMIELIGVNLIRSLPDGLVKVTLIDKSGSGQNLPILSGLHEKFIEGKVLSEDMEIENEMAEIKNSMSAISQSISANGFNSIEEYNIETDEIPQQYHLVFINGFPGGFNKKATENLVSLIESGSKSGIYVFMSINYDPVYGLNQSINGITLNHIIKQMTTFEFSDRPHDLLTKKIITENVELLKFPLKNEEEMKILLNNTFKIKFREFNDSELKIKIKELNEIIKDLELKPVIDIEKVYPKKELFWSKHSERGICVPFAKKGIENVFLSLGVNQYGEDEATHHGMIGGATGSGKTVLIHDFILMTTMFYSPKDIQFYLLDYKEGTEFAVYKDFPYVNILSMESEIEFGHEVLQKAINVMEDRGSKFKKIGAQNLVTYNNRVEETEKLARIIIIIDEFQVLLPRDRFLTERTNELLNDILRRGRSFGINLLLATQTLKGIELDQQILSNMPLRIALKMDEKDSVKIFTEDNTSPKFLKNPGEGIYNKSYGNSKSNIHFQAYKAIGKSVPDTIKKVLDYMDENMNPTEIKDIYDKRFVYNGETIGNIKNNEILQNIYKNNEQTNKIYMGEPAGLSKEHLFIQFENDYAENMLIVGEEQIKAASLMYYMAEQIIKNQSKENRIYFFNFNLQFKDTFENLFTPLFKESDILSDNKKSETYLQEIYKEYEIRKEASEEMLTKSFPKIYIFLYYIESSKLFSGASYSNENLKKIITLLKNGAELGFSFITYATDFKTLTDNDLSGEINKFKKKIALRGGNSIKIFGTEANVSFSKSENVSIIKRGIVSEGFMKFKPYINEEFEKFKQKA